jgi:DNA polymerase (family 10)
MVTPGTARRTVTMTNHNTALAELFRSMAQLLAARKANPHRVRAYQRAAEVLRGWPEDVAAVSARGKLQEIPGIGKELSGKIEEFLQTGRIRAHEDLKVPLPDSVAGWTALPGLSESVVDYLYFRLGIRTLSDLEALVRSHLLRTLPGVSVPEEELLAAIRTLAQSTRPPGSGDSRPAS